MADDVSLDGMLDDKPAEKPAERPAEPEKPAEPEAKPEPVEQVKSRKKAHQEKEFAAQDEGRQRDETTGKFVAKEAKPEPEKPAAPAAPPAPAKPEMTPQERAYLAAAQDERRKRQELEARLKALEAKPAEPAKQFWDDPEAAMKAMEQRTNEAIATTRIQTSETIARSRYQDFDEKIGVFREIATQNPYIAQQAMATPDPAEFAYRLGKNHMELQQAGGMEAMKAKIREEAIAETKVKIEAEIKAKAEAQAAERAAIPPSLSDARSTGVNRPVWGGPPSLSDVLGEKP